MSIETMWLWIDILLRTMILVGIGLMVWYVEAGGE